MTTDERQLMAVYVQHWEQRPWEWTFVPMIRDGELTYLKPESNFDSEGPGVDCMMRPDEVRLHLRMLRWVQSLLVDELAAIALRLPRDGAH